MTFSERWKLGDDDGIHPDEINIIGLLHISKGTWIPILQLDRHIIPRCDFFGEEQRDEKAEEEEEEEEVSRGNPTGKSVSAPSSPSTAMDDDDPLTTLRTRNEKNKEKPVTHYGINNNDNKLSPPSSLSPLSS
jgi:hypothetical protein